MIERLMRMGVRVNHAWGMIETSPIGTMGARGPDWDDLSFEQQPDQVSKQGRVPFGVELRIVDDTGVVLPRDGVSAGRPIGRAHVWPPVTHAQLVCRLLLAKQKHSITAQQTSAH